MKKKILAALCAAIMMTANAYAFSDTAGHWAEKDINVMAEAGFLNGYEDGTFRPDKAVTRAEFMKIISVKYNLVQSDNAYKIWKDVKPTDWYSIYSAAGLLMPVYADNTLLASAQLQRYEAAYALLAIYNCDLSETTASAERMADYSEFADNSDVCDIVAAAIDNGIMQGRDNGFRPFDSLTRAELCTLLNRFDDRTADAALLNEFISEMSEDNNTGAQDYDKDYSYQEPIEENTNTGAADSTGEFESRVLELVNEERAKEGVAPLKRDANLAKAAQLHSEDMAANSYMSHTSLDGRSPWDRMAAAGASFGTKGENVAAGQRTPEEVMNSWMNSQGHRENILNPDYKYIGIGVGYGGSYGIYWTQCFGG